MEKLNTLIKQLNYLLKNDVKYNSYEFLCWFSNTERYLKENYGQDSNEYKTFKDIKFASNLYEEDSDNTVVNTKACEGGLKQAKDLLKSLKEN